MDPIISIGTQSAASDQGQNGQNNLPFNPNNTMSFIPNQGLGMFSPGQFQSMSGFAQPAGNWQGLAFPSPMFPNHQPASGTNQSRSGDTPEDDGQSCSSEGECSSENDSNGVKFMFPDASTAFRFHKKSTCIKPPH